MRAERRPLVLKATAGTAAYHHSGAAPWPPSRYATAVNTPKNSATSTLPAITAEPVRRMTYGTKIAMTVPVPIISAPSGLPISARTVV